MTARRSYEGKVWTSTEIIREIGVTFRQLDYWDQTGLLVPSIRQAAGPGSQRLYDEIDVQDILRIKRLSDLGIGIETIRRDGLDEVEANIITFAETL